MTGALTRAATLIAVLFAVAGCASGEQIADSTSPAASASPTAEPTPTPSPRPTAEPTPRPTPKPSADLARSQQVVYAWQNEFSDYVSFQVIIEIVNEGDGWGEVSAFNSDYQVLDGGGGLVTTGSFTYAFPAFIGPGATGYLIEDGLEEGLDPASFVSVEADGRYDSSDAPTSTFTFQDLQLRQDDFHDGYTASGFVTADTDVTDAAIAVVCVNADGTPLGATWTNLVQNLTAGEAKGFETVGATPPLDPSQCAELRAFAEDTGF